MATRGKFYIPPIDYYTITGRKWQVTGFQIPAAHPDSVFIDHSTGLAHVLFSGAMEDGSGYYTTGATGIYSASGQYNTKDLDVSWGVVNPATNIESPGISSFNDRYLKGYEVNFYDETGKFYSGVNVAQDGSIRNIDLVFGGSGYINPTVVVTGMREGGDYTAPSGTGAVIAVKTLGSGLHKSGEVLSMPESGLGYLSGIYSAAIVSGGSGYTKDTVLLITGSGDGLTEPGMGSGADLRIRDLGTRYGYVTANNIHVPYRLNEQIFGGEAKRKYQIEVIAVDYYDQRTTGRLMVDFPAPKIGGVSLVRATESVLFKINPPTKTFRSKTFENISLQDIAIYRDENSNFEINNSLDKSNFLTSHHVSDSDQGRLKSLKEIEIDPKFFTKEDAFRGYYYKFLPLDDFGTGEPVSYSSGIRVNSNHLLPDTPSGLRVIVDPEKTVGTNIEGTTITNTYLTWKKDRLLSTEN